MSFGSRSQSHVVRVIKGSQTRWGLPDGRDEILDDITLHWLTNAGGYPGVDKGGLAEMRLWGSERGTAKAACIVLYFSFCSQC
jgi:hypothetical protein